ncbi:Golgin imh1 [Coemansia aciculifera]|uniref:Golgin imh1 n=1 Tax=Coemansia aciculifera TaxID=417176 RepID=A0ACC1M2D5_9FUNG|nr:Golgin imh1 [Coemansia aciculifera]
MSEAVDDPGTNAPAGGEPNSDTSQSLQVGDIVSEALISRLAKLEKYEHKLAEVARVYRNLNTARKSIETVLKRLTPVKSIADVEELEAHLSNLNNKSQFAGEQIGALTELDKTNRAKISDLESQVQGLRAADQERQALAKDLDKLTKERKVVEGQLERSNQKLRLDIKALETQLAEASKPTDINALAAQLSSELSETGDVELEPLRELQVRLVDKCGVPEGLVPAAHVEEATARANESHALEMSQLKDILRKELAASEDRLQTATTDSDATIADLRRQLTENKSELTGNKSESTGMTAERVGEIVAAALANRLEMTEPDTPSLQTNTTVAAAATAAASKKKGKKKRKGTDATSGSASAAPSPAAPAPASIATVDDDTTTRATPSEISQLIALIETISVPRTVDDSSHATSEMAAELRSQAEQSEKRAQQALDDLQASHARVTELTDEVQAKAQHITELTAEIESVKGKSEALAADLLATTARADSLAAELSTETARAGSLETELLATTTKANSLEADILAATTKADSLNADILAMTAKADSLNEKLSAETARAEALATELKKAGEERTRLAQALASAQSNGNELKAQSAELTTSYTQACKHRDELRSQLKGLEEHVRAVDADLANSRAQFADKSRAAAQALAQAQELQYGLEKERLAARSAQEEARSAADGLASAQAAADAQRAGDRAEIAGLQRRLADVDHSHASRADRLEAQHAERQAELETMRQSLQRAEDGQTALRVEADRLRDVERDLDAANERLARLSDERALSEQRWKRVHRDLKEELRRLQQREKTAAVLNLPPSDDPPRSNSMTMASVSSLLRAATTASASARVLETVVEPPPLPSSPSTLKPLASNSRHTRSVSNAASTASTSSSSGGSDAVNGDANVNVEYLRNVLFRFFNDKDRRPQLVPVLSTLLRCKTDEIKHIQLLLQK